MLCKTAEDGWKFVGFDGAPAVSLGVPVVELDGKTIVLRVELAPQAAAIIFFGTK